MHGTTDTTSYNKCYDRRLRDDWGQVVHISLHGMRGKDWRPRRHFDLQWWTHDSGRGGQKILTIDEELSIRSSYSGALLTPSLNLRVD